LSKKLIVEVDGAYHNRAAQVVSDEQRTEDLMRLGFQVMRFKNEEIIGDIDKVMERINKELKTSPFTPPLEGTGEASLSNDIAAVRYYNLQAQRVGYALEPGQTVIAHIVLRNGASIVRKIVVQ